MVSSVTHMQGTHRQMTERNVNLTQEIISCLEKKKGGKHIQQMNLWSSSPWECEDTKDFPER